MTALEIKNVSYRYEKNGEKAVSSFSLSVEEGSFTTLLGPSGCGKTTLLGLISGFLEPQEGQIFIKGVDQKGIEPEKRRIGRVFQDYALFPHLTVRQNILYGLKLQKDKTKEEMQKEAEEMAESMDLGSLLDRYPHELSGGQQQRVALARALVLRPSLLLMDEPLSNLDTKLRIRIREDLKEIQEKYGITTIYVTHDQEEALSLSDKLAVMNKGLLLQEGTPQEVFFQPKDKFTADFVGRANFLKGDVLVRPEWFRLCQDQKECALSGVVRSLSFLGDKTRFLLEAEGALITVDLPTLETLGTRKGDTIGLQILHSWKLA